MACLTAVQTQTDKQGLKGVKEWWLRWGPFCAGDRRAPVQLAGRVWSVGWFPLHTRRMRNMRAHTQAQNTVKNGQRKINKREKSKQYCKLSWPGSSPSCTPLYSHPLAHFPFPNGFPPLLLGSLGDFSKPLQSNLLTITCKALLLDTPALCSFLGFCILRPTLRPRTAERVRTSSPDDFPPPGGFSFFRVPCLLGWRVNL